MGDLYQIRIDGRLQDGIFHGHEVDIIAWAKVNYGGYTQEAIKTKITSITPDYANTVQSLKDEKERLTDQIRKIDQQINSL